MSVTQSITITTEEKSQLANSLAATRDRLLQTVNRLTEQQVAAKPGPECWSIADILEHLATFETTVHGLIEQMPNLPALGSEHARYEIDEFIAATVADRTKKLVTPPQGIPTQRWTPAVTLQRFLEARTRTLELLDTNCVLRGRGIPNPLYERGPWDGYEWLLALAVHTARHTEQAEEVKRAVGGG
jgi:hypothetical protein